MCHYIACQHLAQPAFWRLLVNSTIFSLNPHWDFTRCIYLPPGGHWDLEVKWLAQGYGAEKWPSLDQGLSAELLTWVLVKHSLLMTPALPNPLTSTPQFFQWFVFLNIYYWMLSATQNTREKGSEFQVRKEKCLLATQWIKICNNLFFLSYFFFFWKRPFQFSLKVKNSLKQTKRHLSNRCETVNCLHCLFLNV